MKRPLRKKTQVQPQKTSQNSPKLTANTSGDQMTFIEHVYELRSRLFWVVLTLIATSSLGFYYKDWLVQLIVAPLDGQKLIYLTPGGGFTFIFTVCLYFGALLTIPFVMYHIYRFLQPVLGKTSRKLVFAIISLSCVLASAGAIFGYFVAIPAAITFLTTFAGDAVTPSLTAESYLGFVVAYMLGLAALFQLPLLLFIFDYVKPFPPGALMSSQRFVIVGAVIAAAVITPTPDIVNQLIIAGPIIVIYQLGAIAVYMRHKVQHRKAVERHSFSGGTKKYTSPVRSDATVPQTQLSTDSVAVSAPVVIQRPSLRSIDSVSRPHRDRVVARASVRQPASASRTTTSSLRTPPRQHTLRTTDGFIVSRQSS